MWCRKRQTDPFAPNVKLLLDYLSMLFHEGKSYSCINSHKSAICQTLTISGNNDFENNYFIKRFLKGVFNLKPPIAKYTFTWNVGQVLKYLESLFPLHSLSLKLLTLKCVALIALATAQRSQTLANLDLKLVYVNSSDRSLVFKVGTLLKTSRPNNLNQSVIIAPFQKKEICPVVTLRYYILKTKNKRKSTKLFISFKTFKAVTSCSVARWLKTVLMQSGIDVAKFKAHSFRAASTSAAKRAGLSVHEILKTANWSSAQTFKKFYYRNLESKRDNSNYMNSVFDCNLQPRNGNG